MPGKPILEVKHTLAGERKEFPCRALAQRPGQAVILYQLDAPARVGELQLPAGTLTLAYYWEARPYNVYHWVDRQGGTLAYYFNIATGTRISETTIEWRDLGVDLLVVPGQEPRFLDEDDLPEDLNARLWAIIWRAKAELLRHHQRLIEEIEARTAEHLAAVTGSA